MAMPPKPRLRLNCVIVKGAAWRRPFLWLRVVTSWYAAAEVHEVTRSARSRGRAVRRGRGIPPHNVVANAQQALYREIWLEPARYLGLSGCIHAFSLRNRHIFCHFYNREGRNAPGTPHL